MPRRCAITGAVPRLGQLGRDLRPADAEMGMADGHRQRVGGVGHDLATARQQEADHHRHLLLGGVAGPGHGALDLLGGIFVHGEAGMARGQQHHAAGVAELEDESGLRLTTVSSTAASAGRCPSITSISPR